MGFSKNYKYKGINWHETLIHLTFNEASKCSVVREDQSCHRIFLSPGKLFIPGYTLQKSYSPKIDFYRAIFFSLVV